MRRRLWWSLRDLSGWLVILLGVSILTDRGAAEVGERLAGGNPE